jgi:hypothetical protein
MASIAFPHLLVLFFLALMVGAILRSKGSS